MKNIVKALMLGSLAIGALVGCDRSSSSENPSSSDNVISSSENNESSYVNDRSDLIGQSTSSSLNIPSSNNSSSSVSSEQKSSSSAQSSNNQQSSSNASSSSSAISSSSSSSSSVTPLLVDISINVIYVKLGYEVGDSLNLNGLVVTASYTDNSTRVLSSSEYTTDPANGTLLNEVSDGTTVTVSYQGKTKTFTIYVSPATKKNWTAEEAKIMSDHLNGEVLPYNGVEESVVSYSEKYDVVYIMGGEILAAQMTVFTNAMSAANYAVSFNAYANQYSFNKKIETEEGDRFIKGMYYRDENNEFYLEAYDPFYYAFPSALIQELILESFGSEEILPGYEADRYQIDPQDGAVYCYTSSTTSEADYTAVLQEAGWDISQGYDSVNNFYMAVSPNEEYMVYYHYEDSPYNSLDIYVMPINYWNDKPIKAFYEKYTDYSIDIPVLNVANAGYLFLNSNLNEPAQQSGNIELIHSFLYIYNGKQADLDRYVNILKSFSWDVTGSGTLYKALYELEGRGFVRIEAEYSASKGAVILTFYAMLEPYPIEGWPYDEIAAILTEDVTDTLPAYEGENGGFSILNDFRGSSVVIVVESGTEQAALASYAQTLLRNGYTQNGTYGGDPVYESKNKQIWVNPYKGTSGCITIDFKMMENIWPSSKIAKALNELFGAITEKVPACQGADKYEIEKDEIAGSLYVKMKFTPSKQNAVVLNEYINILKANGFKENGEDLDGDMHYLSKNGQLDICPYVYGDDYLYLYITSLGVSEVWPNTAINAWLSARNFTDTLPEYTDNYVSAVIDEEDGFSIVVTLDNPSQDDVTSAVDFYCYTLSLAEFDHTDTLPLGLGEEYTSPNNQFTVIVSPNEDGFDIILDSAVQDPIGSDAFPMDKVLEVFPQADGVIPSFDGGISYEFEGYQDGWCGIMVTFKDQASAEAKMAEYISALTTASFEAQEVWGGYYTGYFSPDGTFAVLLTEYYSENAIYIDVYDSADVTF